MITDRTKAVLKSLEGLAKSVVLVGIPEANGSRKEDDHGPIDNATLGYIHEFGSPAANIPARPFLIPGVEASRDQYMPQLRKAATAALEGDLGQMRAHLNAAGTIARDEVKLTLNTANYEPLKESTLRSRARRAGSAIAAAAQRELDSRAEGNPPSDEVRPLVATGQMRNAITYVVTTK